MHKADIAAVIGCLETPGINMQHHQLQAGVGDGINIKLVFAYSSGSQDKTIRGCTAACLYPLLIVGSTPLRFIRFKCGFQVIATLT